jgi:serine/threonine protein kinase
MWAAGIVLFMLLTGCHPFETGGSTFYLLEQIMNGKRIVQQALFGYDDISEEAKDLILLLLNRDPLERLSARTALKHPWFSL